MKIRSDIAPRRFHIEPDFKSFMTTQAGRERANRLLFFITTLGFGFGVSLAVVAFVISFSDMAISLTSKILFFCASLLIHTSFVPLIMILVLLIVGTITQNKLSYDMQNVLKTFIPIGNELPAITTVNNSIRVQTLPSFTPNDNQLIEIRRAFNAILNDHTTLSQGVMNEAETEYSFSLVNLADRRLNTDTLDSTERTKLGADFMLPIMTGVNAPFGHMAVAGLTGSGKSRFMNWILTVASAANKFYTPTNELNNQTSVNDYIFALDAKNADLASLKYVSDGKCYPNGDSIGTTGLDALRIAQSLVEKMVHRQTIITQYGASNGVIGATWKDLVHNNSNMRPVWLFADELGSWTDILDKKSSDQFKKLIGRLLREGRSAGVFVVSATQNPNVNVLGFAGDQRQQYTAKFFLGYGNSKTNLAMMFGGVDEYPKLPEEPFGIGYYTVEGVANTPEVILTPNMTKFNFDYLTD